MFVPEIFRRNDFDELFEHPFDRAFGEMQRPQMPAMRTDVRETETGYELAIDLPGIKKENVQAQLHDGVLTVSATTQSEAEDKDEKGKYLHRERFSGSYSRSFYVGDAVTEEDIRARFADGVLRLDIPKKEKAAPEKKYITIGD